MPPSIRAFTAADIPACLALFDTNCPPFFAASERADYQAFLGSPADHGTYFVMEDGAEVVACGGVWHGGTLPADVAGLSWGMVRGDLHGRGLGRQLVASRLSWIRQHLPAAREVQIETSQHTQGYYARHGFRVVSRRPDGFAPGLDEIKMVLTLPDS
ncbi:GNAT family N-acetyltransferase [Deinococcus sp. KNUC1210]|uniref:GNAT family N-acetyltransferase n=1 Tax=Deinococcus sp. KNUC1210 TaxID=2917691 RepID=UPI001EF0527B|nr:GNAT family N-acetyltransferase [Deinococcus sp. KNUC1210]ULH15641.1 GNAT family N-acetyltransferase [Deinococcus sp. KNUC1210]